VLIPFLTAVLTAAGDADLVAVVAVDFAPGVAVLVSFFATVEDFSAVVDDSLLVEVDSSFAGALLSSGVAVAAGASTVAEAFSSGDGDGDDSSSCAKTDVTALNAATAIRDNMTFIWFPL
jgi:hypothetical protein